MARVIDGEDLSAPKFCKQVKQFNRYMKEISDFHGDKVLLTGSVVKVVVCDQEV